MATVYVVGTCDTKQAEISFVYDSIIALGADAVIIDVGIFEAQGPFENRNVVKLSNLSPEDFLNATDRGKCIARMSDLLESYLVQHVSDISGVIGLGGSGNTAIVTRGMRSLPIGMPKIMVSTVASGDTSNYVGTSDICMMPSVTDVQGINCISRQILGNAAHAIVGMVLNPVKLIDDGKTLVGMSMFGVTTPCVQQICSRLPSDYEPLVFHAVGTGGKTLEKLIDSNMVPVAIDITLTEVCDLMMGGVMSAGEDRLGAIARTGIPCVLSVGALDMVNFGAIDTVPDKYKDRNLYIHNANVTLMRTTPEENAAMGRWIGEKLNRCEGQIRFLIPEKGVSAIDAPDMPFYSPEADKQLFDALEQTIIQTDKRKIIRFPYHINDPEFADEVIKAFCEITG